MSMWLLSPYPSRRPRRHIASQFLIEARGPPSRRSYKCFTDGPGPAALVPRPRGGENTVPAIIVVAYHALRLEVVRTQEAAGMANAKTRSRSFKLLRPFRLAHYSCSCRLWHFCAAGKRTACGGVRKRLPCWSDAVYA